MEVSLYGKISLLVWGGICLNKKAVRFIFILMLLLVLSACSAQRDTREDVFQYKDSYVGDNSAIGAIVTNLPFREYYKEFALETNEEPYGISIKYDTEAESPHLDDEAMKELALCNSAYLFTLVQNAEWVEYDYGTQQLKVNKDEVEEWYGENFSAIQDEKELRQILQKNLSDKEKIVEYFE